MLSQPDAARYGYELLKATGLKSGTLYPILMRLKDHGLLVAEWRDAVEPGRPPRQIYRLTKSGTAFAQQEIEKSKTDKSSVARKVQTS